MIADEAINGKPNTMYDALQIAEDAGYIVEKINAKADGNEILWNSKANVFCYLNDGVVEYIPDTDDGGASDSDLWVISDVIDTKYSTYYTGNATQVTVTTGFDAGETSLEKITYTGNGAVTIRTNSPSTDLIVNSGNVTHYGIGKMLTLSNSANYTEKGMFAFDADDGVDADDLTTEQKNAFVFVSTAEELTTALSEQKEKIALNADILIEKTITKAYDCFTVSTDTELNLNGHNISAEISTGYAAFSSSVFWVQNTGSLTISGSGNITIKQDTNMGWNARTAVIASRGDIIIDGAVTIANLGGTDMAFAIDMSSWGLDGVTNVTIKSGNIYSESYRAIRLNRQGNTASDPTTTFNVLIEGGLVSGATGAIMCHDGSDTANGVYNITVTGGKLIAEKGNVIRLHQGDENVTLN